MVAFLSLALVTSIAAAGAPDSAWAVTGYVARSRICSDGGRTSSSILCLPSYVDDYILVGALSKRYASLRDGALQLEAEGGDRLRVQRSTLLATQRRDRSRHAGSGFPGTDKVATSAAFGLGLSYATQLPELEVELEGDSFERDCWCTGRLELTGRTARGVVLGGITAAASPFGEAPGLFGEEGWT